MRPRWRGAWLRLMSSAQMTKRKKETTTKNWRKIEELMPSGDEADGFDGRRRMSWGGKGGRWKGTTHRDTSSNTHTHRQKKEKKKERKKERKERKWNREKVGGGRENFPHFIARRPGKVGGAHGKNFSFSAGRKETFTAPRAHYLSITCSRKNNKQNKNSNNKNK